MCLLAAEYISCGTIKWIFSTEINTIIFCVSVQEPLTCFYYSGVSLVFLFFAFFFLQQCTQFEKLSTVRCYWSHSGTRYSSEMSSYIIKMRKSCCILAAPASNVTFWSTTQHDSVLPLIKVIQKYQWFSLEAWLHWRNDMNVMLQFSK